MFALFRENFRIAWDSIRSQLLRTLITVFIIAIGITALVGILSLINALTVSLTGNLSDMGSNTFTIQRYERQSQRSDEKRKVNPVISYQQVKQFSEEFNYPTANTSISFTGTSGAEVKFENEKTDPEITVIGANENFLDNTGLKLDDGRNFTVFDVSNNSNVCILGSDFRKNLFKSESPIGKKISIRGTKFRVIGILEEKGSTFGNRVDLRVIIPIQVARSMFTQPRINYDVSVKVVDADLMDDAQDEAIAVFRNVRSLTPIEVNDFGMQRSDDLIQRIKEDTATINAGAWVISLLTIFGSCIALLNIMLVSVTERTREIGVRKALGAKKSTIAFQFLYEAILVGQMGGALGILLGCIIGYVISVFLFKIDFTIPWGAIIAATTITFVVALISGIVPALKAARLDPIESLRYE
ncbi:MAG: ABC transporter permease [Dokdonia sp.]|jgi:putative ABC transport system permease protein|nr:ABC transporter permease [Cytophagaceae bacterium]